MPGHGRLHTCSRMKASTPWLPPAASTGSHWPALPGLGWGAAGSTSAPAEAGNRPRPAVAAVAAAATPLPEGPARPAAACGRPSAGIREGGGG